MNSNNLSNIITSFTLYKFLDTLTMPFIKTDAYKLGIIDSKGNLLKDINSLNPTEKAAYNEFYQLVFSLKRLLLKVPDPYVRSNLNSVVSALRLISEHCEIIGGNKEQFVEMALRELDACRLINEDGEGGGAPITNSITSGGVSGFKPDEIGVPTDVQKQIQNGKKQIFQRRKPNRYYNDKTNSY
jgi:hypothetical protein